MTPKVRSRFITMIRTTGGYSCLTERNQTQMCHTRMHHDKTWNLCIRCHLCRIRYIAYDAYLVFTFWFVLLISESN